MAEHSLKATPTGSVQVVVNLLVRRVGLKGHQEFLGIFRGKLDAVLDEALVASQANVRQSGAYDRQATFPPIRNGGNHAFLKDPSIGEWVHIEKGQQGMQIRRPIDVGSPRQAQLALGLEFLAGLVESRLGRPNNVRLIQNDPMKFEVKDEYIRAAFLGSRTIVVPEFVLFPVGRQRVIGNQQDIHTVRLDHLEQFVAVGSCVRKNARTGCETPHPLYYLRCLPTTTTTTTTTRTYRDKFALARHLSCAWS